MKINGALFLFVAAFAKGLAAESNVQDISIDRSQIKPLPANSLPAVVSTSPADGALDVDPALKEVTVTFDRDMEPGYSWTGAGPDFPGKTGGKPEWRDKRTCVLPVELEAGRFYRYGINSATYQNFRSTNGMPARPRAFYFVTQGAGVEVKARARKPQIVSMDPPNGAQDVDPNKAELRVTFDIPMAGSFSWTGTGPMFPPAVPGKAPAWSEDRKTAILPVQLKPGTEYRLGLNSPTRFNFQSTNGVPIDAVIYSFKTKP